MKLFTKGLAILLCGLTILTVGVAAHDVKNFDFYISELNYAETPASVKAYTNAPAVINTRESDGGYVEYWQNLDTVLHNSAHENRGVARDYASNTRKLINWDGQQQAGYPYHALVLIAGYSSSSPSYRAYGTYAADDY